MVPVILAHVRLTSVVPIAELEALRDAIRATIAAHAETWGVRIKRRQLTPPQIRALFEKYADRSAPPPPKRRGRPRTAQHP